MRKTVTALTTAVLLAIASTALAGGWAVTSFEELPSEFEAGTTYSLDYVILQHGETPADSGASYVTLRDSEGESLRFDAMNHGDGTYTVEVTIPSEGSWEWEVVSEGWGPQPMGTIEAVPGGAPAGFDLVDALKVILPLATLVAGTLTIREWARTRAGSAPAESG